MTRTHSTLIAVLAVLGSALIAVPSAGAEGYSSANALTGDQTVQPYSPSGDFGSVSAVTGGGSTEQPAQPTQYRSVNSITGGSAIDVAPQRPASAGAPEDRGFDWGDALIGALVASGILSLAFVGARSVARHRRAATEPRV